MLINTPGEGKWVGLTKVETCVNTKGMGGAGKRRHYESCVNTHGQGNWGNGWSRQRYHVLTHLDRGNGWGWQR